MPSFCVVSNCEHRYSHSENVSFHKFPRHSKELLARWIQFTDRGFDWKPSRWSSVCSRHFLPGDFRESASSRKCLKRDAIPSITIKNFDGNFLDLQSDGPSRKFTQNTQQEPSGISCRLCGLCCNAIGTFSSNFEIFGMIQKCFPSLNIQQDDNLPKDLCTECLQRLQSFSEFIDSVLRTQKDLEKKFSTKAISVPLASFEKPIKIKQEPTTKIKQEISEGLHDTSNDDFDVGTDEDQFVDQKSQFSEFPFINPQEIINNCDIMEIISLDDAFIDIPDDEGGTDELKAELKESFENSTLYPGEEHNYSKPLDNMKKLDDGPYKTEKPEDFDFLQAETPKNCKDIIVINESIVKPIPAFDLYQCKDCPMQFLTEGILAEHSKLNHSFNEYMCVLCDESFKSFFHFLRHKLTKHKKTARIRSSLEVFSCPMCGKTSPTKLAFNNHKKYICKHQQEKSYTCKYCPETLKKWIHLRKHEKECRKLRNTNNLAERNAPSGSIEHLTEVNGSFSCKLCGRIYKSRRNALQHEKSHRPVEQWNYNCGDCGKMFDFCQDLRCHLNNKECKAAPVGADHVYFVCVTCGNQFKSLTKLKWHNLIHTGVKPFVCESCGKSFRSFNNLYQHKITHTTVRRHKCDLCDKTFKRRGGLNQHKRAFHFRLRPHECPVCKHRFALKGDMVRCKHSALKDRGIQKF